MDKLRKALSGHEELDEEEGSILTQMVDTNSLSYTKKVKGFVFVLITGFCLSLLALYCLSGKTTAPVTGFAIFYSIGNILAVASTCFLVSPSSQVKNMSSTRVVALLIIMLAFIMTLVSAILIKKSGLAFFMIILQYLAIIWYSMSYIPFAMNGMKHCCKRCMGMFTSM